MTASADASDPAEFHHVPVLRDEVVELFAAVPAGLVVDGTLGGAGHAAALLDAHAQLRLLGLDRDPTAVRVAGERLARFGDRARVVHARFDAMAELAPPIAAALGVPVVGVLLDLGVSSPQFDRAERGFSYRHAAPLDMRMDPDQALSADDVVNRYDEVALAEVLFRYADERFARRIARAVVAARPVTSTVELAELVRDAIPAPARRRGGHPAKRTFQAIRIEVNGELRLLEATLGQAIDLLAPGGRAVVISYHSGEDRLVKAAFRTATTGGCTCPPGLPCACGAVPLVRSVGRRGSRPTAEEIERNPRAESARLRVVEKLEPLPGDATTAGVEPWR
jgi:16S rRNA (cytosine1402-N4)-methyltransferase